MQADRLRDFLKFFRSHLAWFILSAGFFAVILISALFLSTKYVVDTAVDPSQIVSPTATPEDLELAAELELPTAPEAPAPVATASVKPVPTPSIVPSPSVRPTLVATPSSKPAVTPLPAKPTPTPFPPKITNVVTEMKPTEQIPSFEYTVKSGDTLWNIAENHYRDGHKFSRISHENNLKNPNMIQVGQKLTLPRILAEENVAPTQKGSITDSAWSDDKTVYVDYTIVKGDSLWKIAERELGNPYRWVELYQANKAVIGSNPDLIYPSVKIRVPSDTPADEAPSSPSSSTPQSFNWTSSLLQ